MIKQFILGIFIILLSSSCSYSVYSNSLPHLKTIAVERFGNESDQFDLEEEILNYLTAEFNSDGRLRVVTLGPDCRLEGKLLDYSRKIDTYDDTGIEEYLVKMLFSIRFMDLTTEEVIWEKESLIVTEAYSENDDNVEYKTEEEAQDAIYQKLFDEIMKNTLEQW